MKRQTEDKVVLHKAALRSRSYITARLFPESSGNGERYIGKRKLEPPGGSVRPIIGAWIKLVPVLRSAVEWLKVSRPLPAR